MTGLLPRPEQEQLLQEVPWQRHGDMGSPKTLVSASYWMQLGCERLRSPKPLSKRELKTLIGIAEYCADWKSEYSNELDNAFWPQMAAVFRSQADDREGAARQWERASKRKKWQDYQPNRLFLLSDRMDAVEGSMSWYLAALYYRRSSATSEAIESYAEHELKGVGFVTRQDVQKRLTTLLNAQLMNDGARSLRTLEHSLEISYLVAEPAKLAPREMLEARGKFYEAINRAISPETGNEAKRIYNEFDSRPVLTREFDPEGNARRLTALSIVAATGPSALIVCTIVGGLVLLVGVLVSKYAGDHNAFSWPPALAVGSALGVGVFSVTLVPLAGIVALASAMLLVFTPRNERSRVPYEFGPLFSWTLGFLAALFTVVTVAALSLNTTPAEVLVLRAYGVPPQILMGRLLGLAGIILALLLLAAPMWAFAKRVRTPYVLGITLTHFGKVLLTLSLAGVVVGGPLSVYADARLRDTFRELVGNEPIHYINRFQ